MININKCLKNPFCIILGIIIIFIIILFILKISKKNIEKFGEDNSTNFPQIKYTIKPCKNNVCSIQNQTANCIKEVKNDNDEKRSVDQIKKTYKNNRILKNDLNYIKSILDNRLENKDTSPSISKPDEKYVEHCALIGDPSTKFNTTNQDIKSVIKEIQGAVAGLFNNNVWKSQPEGIQSYIEIPDIPFGSDTGSGTDSSTDLGSNAITNTGNNIEINKKIQTAKENYAKIKETAKIKWIDKQGNLYALRMKSLQNQYGDQDIPIDISNEKISNKEYIDAYKNSSLTYDQWANFSGTEIERPKNTPLKDWNKYIKTEENIAKIATDDDKNLACEMLYYDNSDNLIYNWGNTENHCIPTDKTVHSAAAIAQKDIFKNAETAQKELNEMGISAGKAAIKTAEEFYATEAASAATAAADAATAAATAKTDVKTIITNLNTYTTFDTAYQAYTNAKTYSNNADSAATNAESKLKTAKDNLALISETSNLVQYQKANNAVTSATTSAKNARIDANYIITAPEGGTSTSPALSPLEKIEMHLYSVNYTYDQWIARNKKPEEIEFIFDNTGKNNACKVIVPDTTSCVSSWNTYNKECVSFCTQYQPGVQEWINNGKNENTIVNLPLDSRSQACNLVHPGNDIWGWNDVPPRCVKQNFR